MAKKQEAAAPAATKGGEYNQELSLDCIIYSKTNPPSRVNEKDLTDLVESIKGPAGVIEPIIVRPAKANGTYELVCGHRRHKASLLAGRKTIPAIVKQLNDEEALDLQIMENLHRKDLHPLDEAMQFKLIFDTHRYTTLELAQRIGKSHDYITLRLKLNDLIEPFKKMFIDGKMLLGHALLLCRFTEADQQEALNEINDDYNGDITAELTVAQLRENVERDIICQLKNAPFDINDESLSLVGSCLNCSKRSGANKSLFADFEEGDRCFDKQCFKGKANLAFERELERALANPDVVLLYGWVNDPQEEERIKQLRKKGFKLLKEYNDYRESYDKKDKKSVKGFVVSGRQRGTYINVVLLESTSNINTAPKAGLNATLEMIEREKKLGLKADREELIEKIMGGLDEQLEYKNELVLKKYKGGELTVAESKFLLLCLLSANSYNPNFPEEWIDPKLKDSDSPKKIWRSLANIDEKAHNIALRRAIYQLIEDAVDRNGLDSPIYHGAIELAEEYMPVALATWRAAISKTAAERDAKLDAKLKAAREKAEKKPVAKAKAKAL